MADFEITELGPTDHINVGDSAPDFVRPLVEPEHWEDVSLSSLTEDSSVLLVFHPMDGDFIPVYIWKEIRDRSWGDIEKIEPIGVSISTPYEHSRFLDEWNLQARLFSDPSNTVGEKFGIVHDLDGMAGITEPRPSTFLINTDMTVEYAWVGDEWPAFPPYDDIEDVISNQ